MNEELTKLIIKKLGKHHDRNDIIGMVCEQSTLSWTEASKLIEQVEAENGSMIAGRQRPFLILVSAGTLILGIGLLFYNSQFFIGFFQGEIFEQLLSLQGGYYRVIGLITGLGMAVGGLLGLGKSVLPLLKE
ncbi:MAG: hypothetical protein H7X86_10690 [Gorillibacterium sp.]|nr:hypothetical protein [Gorillibacterium sp.]